MRINKKIGFIGAGNMCEAMVGALIKSRVFDSSMINVSDINDARLDMLSKTYGVHTTKNNARLFNKSDIVVLSIKPQICGAVLGEITGQEGYGTWDRKLLISIMAGVSLRNLEKGLYAPLEQDVRGRFPLVRVMPNTAALVLEGMSGMSANINVAFEDFLVTKLILESMGKAMEFTEETLDAVTALSGSGPAYLFYLVEIMISAGKKMGLSSGDAESMTMKTIKGALKLMEEYEDSPENLRKKVTSPGGTTEAAFDVMENRGVKQLFVEAIMAARDRSVDLGS